MNTKFSSTELRVYLFNITTQVTMGNITHYTKQDRTIPSVARNALRTVKCQNEKTQYCTVIPSTNNPNKFPTPNIKNPTHNLESERTMRLVRSQSGKSQPSQVCRSPRWFQAKNRSGGGGGGVEREAGKKSTTNVTGKEGLRRAKPWRKHSAVTVSINL
jgi:hypothetical protein